MVLTSTAQISAQGRCFSWKDFLSQSLFHLLDVHGADVVLGMEWLGTLGSTNTDFSVPSISFQRNGVTCTLIGLPPHSLTSASFHHLSRFINLDAISECHTVPMIPTTPTDKEFSTLLTLENLTQAPANFNNEL